MRNANRLNDRSLAKPELSAEPPPIECQGTKGAPTSAQAPDVAASPTKPTHKSVSEREPEPPPSKGLAIVETGHPPVLLNEPYAQTVIQQLGETIPERDLTSERYRIALDDLVASYKLMNPRNPAESTLCRLILALSGAGMQSFGRAARAEGLPLTQERDLKLGMKAAETVAELIKVLDGLRARQQNVSIGQVNVHAGAQAIVGPVNQPTHRTEALRSSKDDDDDDSQAA